MESTENITNTVSGLSLDDFPDNHNIVERDGFLRIPVHAVNPHLICGLCQGYLYEACTITECMHSFCKSCLVKHLHRSLNCPMCAILIHPTDPFVHIRLDGLLQDIVYALLPQVEKDELEKERLFYEKNGGKRPASKQETRRSSMSRAAQSHMQVPSSTPKLHQPHKHSPKIYPSYGRAPPVALNLKCLEPKQKSHELVKPFVHVTGGATIENLTNFLRKKLQITETQQVDLYCPSETGMVSLSDTHTLRAVKDMYCQDANIVHLNYEIREP
ncbi:polycomb group RING finger protein 3-like [Elysia marginata]|uniref:Polycomb group RING finger protein 3-like n=1 Tax=Elysia marginata TaxID=1093978 RepID=A0AAV4HFV5_9GAST|nr:polycomb group RING finger protein 3-like [Elysia marginata]